MKVAISGKGGTGKTTLAALLCLILAREGKKITAIDADPGANLGAALGFPPAILGKIVPLAEMKELIEERTGAKPGAMGGLFKLNPRVDDLPEKIGYMHGNIRLIVMGTIRSAGSGCLCAENALLRTFLKHLVVDREEPVILDIV